MPRLRILKLIAASDPNLFEHHLRKAGLTIVGWKDGDPLRRTLQNESVLSIATTMTEDVHDTLVMTTYQQQLQEIAEAAGYLVGFSEGLDQMPGTLPNPIRNVLRPVGGLKDTKEETPADEEAAAPPPDGAAPPPA